MSGWTVWKRVETYVISVLRNDRGDWDGGYARLTGGLAEMRTPTPVTFGHPSQDDAANAVEQHLKYLGPRDRGEILPTFKGSLGSPAARRAAPDARSARSRPPEQMGAVGDLTETGPPPHRPRVLCIDDDRLLLALFTSTLEAQGFEPLTAPDGPSGIKVAQTERPDLILVDVLMPRMSGYDVCRAIRSFPACQNTPIVVLTALADPQLESKALAAGATLALPKPFNLEKLIEVLRATFKNASSAPPA